MTRRRNRGKAAALLLTVAVALAPVFADGFESSDARYWTAEEPPCSDDTGHVAPLCHWSWDSEAWLAACESGARCARLCFPSGEPNACVMLLVEQP